MNDIFSRLKKFDLWWTGPLIMVLLYFMEDIFSWIDPTSHIVHPEIWQFIFLAMAGAILFGNASFAFIAINFPTLYSWYEKAFDRGSDLSDWQRAQLFCALFISMALLPVLILMALV